MLNVGGHRFRDEIASLIGWWAEAGVDAVVSEATVDWLASPARAAVTAPAATRPTDLAAFHALLADGEYMPGAPPPARRIGPAGDPASRLMIVTDMPDDADLRARRLFSSEAALFDAMLAAMGCSRETVYLAPLSPARIAGGRLGAARAPLGALMRAHLALVRPMALLMFGDETCRALLGVERVEGCARLHSLNHDGGTVAAIATVHPRILVRQPACKADAWAAMRKLIGVLAQ